MFEPIDTPRIEAVVRSRIHGFRLIWKQQTDSTNTDILQLAENGAPAWTVVGADIQEHGRGRHKRYWASPEGGLYISILLRFEDPQALITLIPLAVGISVFDALQAEAKRRGKHLDIKLKWPNDLISPRGKLAGILCESRWDEKSGWLISAGIGVNLYPLGEDAKRLVLGPVTSLSEESDIPWTRAGLITSLLLNLHQQIADWRDDPAAIRDGWLTRSGALGSRIRTTVNGEVIEGSVRGLGSTGSLLLETPSGIIEINSVEGIENLNE